MYMGNSVAESASDLALNTKLSQYDKDLNDIYGLFANAESENDVLKNLNDYLSSCMQSAGIEKTDAEKQDSNQVISDLLGIQVDKDKTTIGPVQNANLENPAELERQIVEFMKYRGPIDISKNIVSRFRKIVKKTKNVSKESDITEKMNDYLEEEQSILELLETAYNEGMKPYMTDYNNNKNKISDTETLVNKLNSAMKKILTYLQKLATPIAGVTISVGVIMRKLSFGDEEKMLKGKKVIINAIIGYAIIISIDLIIKFIEALI